MVYKEFEPTALLTDFVKSYWWFDNTTNKPLDYTILPDGCFDLIISFTKQQQQEISLTGLWTKQVAVSIPPNTQLFGIRFKLLAVDYMLQQKIALLLNSEQSKEPSFWQLNEYTFTHLESVTEKLNNTMLSLVTSHESIDHRKRQLFNLLYQTNGEQTVTQYAEQVCWSSRQINRYFSDRFGLPLKSYCTILKCHASYKHLKKGQLYPEQDYFDQSHFIKDLKKHTGSSPTQLFENKNDRFLQLTTMTKK
ncbi:transcriptional regulator [Neptunitalea chrysea]|uniref:Transcriptional regulator n=1 Tax=Neptunitalea chrysea TaxID=1647581 RepID=A0A9W6B4G5_9FLAO|nr:helix-turn-helix domain-containing protein [Neptunitalea chrysea]GLB52473.1 transcriptional regulator [Neptunitalea chrysea]